MEEIKEHEDNFEEAVVDTLMIQILETIDKKLREKIRDIVKEKDYKSLREINKEIGKLVD